MLTVFLAYSLQPDGSSLHYDERASDTMRRSKTEKEKGEFAKMSESKTADPIDVFAHPIL